MRVALPSASSLSIRHQRNNLRVTSSSMLRSHTRSAAKSLSASRRRTFSSSSIAKMRIVPVPVRDDNYAYLLINETTNQAAVVDPYDMLKVGAAALKEGVHLVANLTTHHHHDHSGGNNVSLYLSHVEELKSNSLPRLLYVISFMSRSIRTQSLITPFASSLHIQASPYMADRHRARRSITL